MNLQDDFKQSLAQLSVQLRLFEVFARQVAELNKSDFAHREKKLKTK